MVVKQCALESFAKVVGLIVWRFDPLWATIDREDDLRGDTTVFEREVRDVFVVVLLVVLIPNGAADVFDQALARDDDREFAKAVGLDNGFTGIRDSIAVEDACENRMENGVRLARRNTKLVFALE